MLIEVFQFPLGNLMLSYFNQLLRDVYLQQINQRVTFSL